ncbi:MAG: carbohydrate kinase family protein [Blastocatellia bacterium]
MKATNPKCDVITVGDVFIDLVMTGFPVWPEPGEESFATELRREIGGGAAITACGLAKLGKQTATLAMIGNDGQWFTERLSECGVSTALIHQLPNEATATTISVSTAKDRAFFTYTGANRGLGELLRQDAIRRELCQARHVHFACPIKAELLSDLTEMLHAANCRVSIDVGWQVDWLTNPAIWQAFKQVDLFLPNEREAELMTGESEPEAMLRKFAEAGLSHVALKLGERGSMALWEDEIFSCPPLRVLPVDTTGAGDCFDAGLIFGWLENKTPQDCLRLANICGALSTAGLGGVSAFPSRQRTDELLNYHGAAILPQVPPRHANPTINS